MYIQIDEDFQEHPKSRRLCRILMDARGWSWCVLLWRYCTKFHPDGDLTDVDPADLEYNLGWTLDPGKLFGALISAGFIDQEGGKTTVHDWMEYQGGAIIRMRTERERKRQWRQTGATPARTNTSDSSVIPLTVRQSDDAFSASEITPPDSNPVSARNLVSVRGRSADVPESSAGRPWDKPATSVVSIAEHSRATESECCEPLAAKDSQPAASGGELSEPGPKKRQPRKPPPPDGTPVIRVVPCNGPVATWDLTEGYVAKVQEYFPGLDVRAKIMSALFWLDANPDRRKTAGGMTAFLARWLARENNGSQGQLSLAGRGPPAQNPRKTNYKPL